MPGDGIYYRFTAQKGGRVQSSAMEPRIQFALTADGASVAFWSLGSGQPVIQMPTMPFTHIQMEWQDPDFNAWYTALLQRFRLIRYDTRGCGLSSAEGQVYTLDSMVEDLRAVADRAGAERFGLIGPVQAGPAAIAFAARYPERVTRLVLWSAIEHARDIRTARFEALRQLSSTDWPLFCEAAAHAIVTGWEHADSAHRMARIMREGSNREIHEGVMRGYLEEDISGLVPLVRCPVMVAHRRDTGGSSAAAARRLAAALPDASLASFPGHALHFLTEARTEIVAAIREFLDVAEPQPGKAGAGPGGFCTLLYTDVEGHTAIMSKLGDERGRIILREHERITREALADHAGVEVLATGDGFLARFGSAQEAVRCAIQLQRELTDLSATLPVELRVRAGISAGETGPAGDELFGAAVALARHIASLARGGEVLVANVVRELVAGKGFAFSSRDGTDTGGAHEPLRVWELHWSVPAT